MGVILQVLPRDVADVGPPDRWLDRAEALGAPQRSLNRQGTSVLAPYLLAVGATYELAEPPPPQIKRHFPELDQAGLAAIWSGTPPPGVTRERAETFYRAQIAYAETREQRPGTPAFKLARNGPPWHITTAECRDVLAIAAEDPTGDRDPSPERRGFEIWRMIQLTLEHGAAADGVLVL